MRTTRRDSWASICFLAVALTVLGCGPVAGSERGPCFGNGTCSDGLTCLSDVCVRVEGDAAEGAAGRPDAAPSDALLAMDADEPYAQEHADAPSLDAPIDLDAVAPPDAAAEPDAVAEPDAFRDPDAYVLPDAYIAPDARSFRPTRSSHPTRSCHQMRAPPRTRSVRRMRSSHPTRAAASP